MYLSNDILVNCIQKGLRSNWLSDSAKNIAKNQKELTIRKRNWINSFNSSLSIPIPIPFQFQFLELELELVSIPIPIPELTPALGHNQLTLKRPAGASEAQAPIQNFINPG